MNELHLVQMNRISFRQLSEYSMANCVEDKVVLVDNLSLFPFGKSKECFIAADFIALLFCTEGHLEMNMDGRHYTLSKGDVLFCGQGVTLQGITMSTSCQGKVLCLSWEYGQILFLRSTYQWNSILQLRHNPLLQSSIEEQKLYRAYYQLFAAKLNCYYYVSGNIDCIFQGFFNDLYRMADRYIMQKTQQDTYPTSLRQEDLFKRFITLVKEKHGHEHFCSFYAGQLCVTSKHLTKVVKTVSGKSVSQWISTYLMEQIIFYLKTTNLTIAEIAYKLNFSNASFFGQYVKKRTGKSPAKLRRTLQAVQGYDNYGINIKKQAYVQPGDYQTKQPTGVQPDETDVPLYFQRAGAGHFLRQHGSLLGSHRTATGRKTGVRKK